MSLPSFSLKNPSIVIAFVAVAVTAGLIQFFTMPRRADPSFTIRTCTVTTQWPGVEAERVEQLVTFPLEEEINRLEEIDVVRSTTTTGLSVIYVDLEDALPVGVIPQIWDRVRSKVDIVRPNLPSGVMDPVINDDFGDTTVMLVAVYEKAAVATDTGAQTLSYTPRQLEIVADRLKERIGLLPGVAKAETHGVRNEVIYLETDRSNWANIDMTSSELAELVQARNIFAPGGSIETDRARYGVKPTGEFDAVSQIGALIVARAKSGAPIYLRDVGIQVRRDYEDPPSMMARYGEAKGSAPTVIVSFTMKDGAKVTDLGAEVRQLISDMRLKDKLIPPDLAANIVFDESVFVEKKISDFTSNVIQAVIIVVSVALVLAGFRSALVMAAAIPFVMIISIGLSASIGIELEQMSIASLIIALGMLVDNAVVVCDNIRRFQSDGFNREDSVVKGVEQIMYPILMGTLTTVFAFMPMAIFLLGAKKEYVFSIPAVVSITLSTSWVLALTLTSLMAYWIVRPRADGTTEKTPAEWVAGVIGRLIRRGRDVAAPSVAAPSVAEHYASLVKIGLKVKPLVLGIAAALLGGVFFLPVGMSFFPDDLRNYMYIDVWLPEGSSLAATDKATRQVERIMRELSPVESAKFSGERLDSYYASIGGSGPRFALGVNPQPPASNFAQLIVKTTDARLTDQFVKDIRARAAATVPGARVIPRKLALGPPVDTPIGIRIFGSGFSDPGFAEIDELLYQSERLKDVFRHEAGVWDVHDSWGDPGYQLDVDIDEDQAKLAGVTNATVATTFNAYFSGHFLTTYREGDHRVPVFLRLPPDQRGEILDARTIFVEGAFDKVPVDTVARVTPRRTTTKIERRDRNRMIELRARVEPGVLASGKLTEVMPQITELEATLPPGFSYEMSGTLEETEESVGQFVTAFGIGMVLIVLTLIVQYNSFVKPMLVLMTVPMGAIGALFGLWISGNPMGFMPMLGFVSLAGVVVNSGILYVEFADALIVERLKAKDGLAPQGQKGCNGLTREAFHTCLMEAGRLRLLPIFLTASTTVGGMIPLALFGGPLWQGMAYLLIFGLIIATILTLFVLPVIYAAFVEYLGMRTVRVDA
ncbi:MAG: efflux RND transporter permease subunit [Planctomycetota bacterium]|jgi:multidrug efflux pump subunit AcrB